MNKKFDKMEKIVNDLKRDNKYLKQQNQEMSKQINELKTSFFRLESRTTEAERKHEHLEAMSRRDNLKFFGIEDQEKETWEQSEDKVREYMRKELNLDDSEIKIERAHRLPNKSSPRPIIVKFSFYKDRETVLRAYRQKRKDDNNEDTSGGQTDNELRQRPVRVSEDFPERVTKMRTKLFPFLKSCREAETTAYLRYDTLVVEGQPYIYDEDRGRPVPK